MANNDLELKVSLNDEASKGFQQLEKEVNNFGKATKAQQQAIARHMKESSTAYKNAEKDIKEMSKATRDTSKDTKNFADAMKRANKDAKDMAKSQKSLTKSIIGGGLALAGLQIGLQEVGTFLKDSVNSTLEYNNALNATTATVRAFGLEEENLLPAVEQLTNDGLLTQADAYRTLSQLLAGGLNIEEATELIGAYKDVAAFGRDTTISFSEAVNNNAEAFLTESSMIGNRAGLQENFNQLIQLGADAMGKSVTALTANERAEAKRIGTLMVAERAEGNAAKMAETFQGALIRQQTSIEDVRRLIGNALTPSLKLAMNSFSQAGTGSNGFRDALKGLGVALAFVVGHLRNVATAMVEFVKINASAVSAIKTALTGGGFSFEDFKNQVQSSIGEMKTSVQAGTTAMNEAWYGTEDVIGDVSEANRDWMDENAKNAKKMAEDIANEMQRFNEAMRKMNMQFDESMKDLIISHKERVSSLEKDLQKEKTSFDEAMKDKEKSFDKSMLDLEKRHKDKTDKILKDLQKEKDKTKEEISEISEEYDTLLISIRKNGDNRILSLKAQLDKEKARQSSANQEKINVLNRMIDEETVAIADSIRDHEALKQDEINDELADRDERLAEIQADLKEENESFDEAVKERKDTYKDETQSLIDENTKRLAIIQAELDIEKALQQKHADEFAKFKDAVAEDDITRLIRKNDEERKEAERAHGQKLDDLKRRSDEEASASRGNNVSRTDVSTPTSGSGGRTSSPTPPPAPSRPSIGAGGGGGGGGAGGGDDDQSFLDRAKESIGSFFSGIGSSIGGLLGFANGGEFEVGGKSGVDQNVVAFKASRGERVRIETPQQQSSGGVTLNAPITVMSSEVDIDQLLERISWSLNKSGIIGTR